MRIFMVLALLLMTFSTPGRAKTLEQLIGRKHAPVAEKQSEKAFEAQRLYAIAGIAPVQYELAQAYKRSARDATNFKRIEAAETYVSQALVWHLAAGDNGQETARTKLIQFSHSNNDPTEANSKIWHGETKTPPAPPDLRPQRELVFAPIWTIPPNYDTA